MKIFILEDDPNRIRLFCEVLLTHDVTITTSVQEAKAKWAPPYDVVLLDHDLGGAQMVLSEEENTGFQFCRFLTEPWGFWELKSTPFVIHSYNPEGARAMLRQLKLSYHNVVLQPFGPTLLDWLKRYTNAEI